MTTSTPLHVESALDRRLAALERALKLCDGRVDERVLTRAADVHTRAWERLGLSGEHTVVAIAGATGSGKSSLFNAIAGRELARTGVRRPTTAHAQACVWGPDGAGALLDWLDIPRRHRLDTDELNGLVLLDLPDHDSTEVEHRVEVDRLVRLVDMLVWVFDPQKYADAAVHERYLRPLATHAKVTICVFNQVDRVDPAVVTQCIADLRMLLIADGLSDVRIIGTSAATGAGIPELRAVLADAVATKRAHLERLAADVDRAAGELSDHVGDGQFRHIGPRERARLSTALGVAAGVPAVAHAVGAAHRYRGGLATGWPLTRWLRRLRPDPLRRLGLRDKVRAAGGGDGGVTRRTSLPAPSAVALSQVDIALRGIGDAAAGGLPVPWADAVRSAAREREPELADALDRAVAGTNLGADRVPRWWSIAGVVQWVLASSFVVGAVWLAVLAVLAWLRVPEPPTPEFEGWPVPTLLVAGGLLVGPLLAFVCRRLIAFGARRRARRTKRRLDRSVEDVADRLVVGPVDAELDRYREAHTHVEAAARR